MKATTVLFLACALVLGSALPSGARDIVGVYADLEGTVDRIFVEPYETFEVYVLLKDPSSLCDIVAWDCLIVYPDDAAGGNVVVTAWTLAGGGTNMAAEPEFQAEMLDVPPLQGGDIVVLLKVEAHVTTSEEAAVYILGSTLDPLGNGRPTYSPFGLGEESGKHVAMNQSSGDASAPVFAINSYGPAPVSEETWSRIKALYR